MFSTTSNQSDSASVRKRRSSIAAVPHTHTTLGTVTTPTTDASGGSELLSAAAVLNADRRHSLFMLSPRITADILSDQSMQAGASIGDIAMTTDQCERCVHGCRMLTVPTFRCCHTRPTMVDEASECNLMKSTLQNSGHLSNALPQLSVEDCDDI
jgi:hypothetical protein